MSHFTVLVIGDNPEKQLAPYQENNMGDCPREYIEFNNVEEEYRKQYEEDTKPVESIYYNSIEIRNEEDFDKIYNAYHSTLNESVITKTGTSVITAPVKITLDDPMIFINLDLYQLYTFYISPANTKTHERKTMTVRIHSENKLSKSKTIVACNRVDEPVKVAIKNEMSWDEYMTEYCGYEFNEEQGAYGYWENPNRKWDWYQLGGRWNGYFQLKPTLALSRHVAKKITKFANNFNFTEGEIAQFFNLFKNDKEKFKIIISKYSDKANAIHKFVTSIPKDIKPDDIALAYRAGVVGPNGVFGSHRKNYVGRADVARVGDIDFDAMMDQAGDKARKDYVSALKAFGGFFPKIEKAWSEFVADKSMDWDTKRKAYYEQPAFQKVQEVVKAWQAKVDKDSDEYYRFSFGFDLNDYQCTEEEYVNRARNNAISTFAVVKNGKWYEKGEMGWFNCVTNEKEQASWNDEFASYLKDLPEDTILSVYDCHI